MIKKFLCGLTAVLILLTQAGCGSGEGDTFRYDIPSKVKSLDPQFSTDQNSLIIVSNIYEGLLRRKSDGQITSGIAESYKASPDGCTYTFYLKDAKWSDGSYVTSNDFAFAFYRMFAPNAVSPYAQNFLSIKGAKEILGGSKPVKSLGISSPDQKTFIIQLEKPDPFLIQLLCTPAAMPCNEKAFVNTKGRYGLAKEALLTNGPFTVTRWEEDKPLVISRNEYYYDAKNTKPQAVYFYIGREDTTKLLFKGKSDVSKISYEELKEANKRKFNITATQDTTWAIVFNTQKEIFSDQRIRSALQGAIDRQDFVPMLAKNLAVSSSVIPPAASIYEKPYRQLAGQPFEPIYNPVASKEQFATVLKELEIKKLTGIEIIMPEYGETIKYGGMVQQMWQANLSLFANLKALSEQDFSTAIASGNFDIAIVPLRLKTYGPQGILSMFTSNSNQNIARFSDSNYDSALAAALSSTKLETAVKQFSTAEDILIESAAVIPLYTQTNYIAVSRKAQGIELSPFGDIYFKNAKYK